MRFVALKLLAFLLSLPVMAQVPFDLEAAVHKKLEEETAKRQRRIYEERTETLKGFGEDGKKEAKKPASVPGKESA